MAKSPKSIDEQVAAYRNALVRRRQQGSTPKPDPTERLARVKAALEGIQARLTSSDERRVRMLIQEMRLHLDARDFRKVHAVAEEIAHMSRLLVHGLEGEHPILSTVPPPPALPSGTGRVVIEGDEP